MENHHIAIVATYFYPSYGGMQNFTARLARGFKKAGFTVTVVAPQIFHELSINPIPNDLDVRIVTSSDRREFWHKVPTVLATCGYPSNILAIGIELGEAVDAQLECLSAYVESGSTVCLRVATSYDIQTNMGENLSSKLSNLNHIVVLNQEMLYELRVVLPDYECVSIVPVIVDTSEFRLPSAEDRKRARIEIGLPEDCWVCIWSGRLHPDKKLELALDAWSAARINGTLVVLGSEDGNNQRYASRIFDFSANHYKTGVLYMRARPAHMMCDVYSAGDCLLVTSCREGMCNSVVEALACGLHVIACDIPGTRIIKSLIPSAPLTLTLPETEHLSNSLQAIRQAVKSCNTSKKPLHFDQIFGPDAIVAKLCHIMGIWG